ncbi:uroporphyrinogen-III synthase [Halalkalibaculum sp. DA3122]|uniref:uroporphyrinogen-III synthase n=1 Tax=unclassified Halalkalibaculum TaxID=2964617 RepID=UPI003754E6FD
MSTDLTILLTSAMEDAEDFLEWSGEKEISVLHLPLERYVPLETDTGDLPALLEETENIIYGHKRNARFFIEQAREQNLLEVIKNRINLVSHQRAADYLEEQGVPAIFPGSEEPIKMLEFLMRLRRLGTVFYPCGTHKNEEIPGLLKELDIEVNERAFYELKGPTGNELETYQGWIRDHQPDTVVCHSRRAVNRIGAAFPEVFASASSIIAGDRAVAEKLAGDHKVQADVVAEGDWPSIFERVKELAGG